MRIILWLKWVTVSFDLINYLWRFSWQLPLHLLTISNKFDMLFALFHSHFHRLNLVIQYSINSKKRPKSQDLLLILRLNQNACVGRGARAFFCCCCCIYLFFCRYFCESLQFVCTLLDHFQAIQFQFSLPNTLFISYFTQFFNIFYWVRALSKILYKKKLSALHCILMKRTYD